MIAFRRWIQIRKRWIRGKKLLGSFGALMLLLGSLQGMPTAHAAGEPAESWMEAWRQDKQPRTVKHVRSYICGEEMTMLGKLDAGQVEQLLKENPEWTIKPAGEDEIVVLEQIADLSETCKQRAYFSLDKLGHLSLFEGPPEEDRVIRTFFQLDTHYLESSLPRQHWQALNEGIRVSDVDEYNSVLSTFSEYAVHADQGNKTPG
ncbi:BofC C-terminal domain-containing protein [Paenibacillus daejeonensis]|uniref:BofC C-terminal domain-containing protein n=1 Tax=Paenibacillus daejeonensis TaxID=135193 RepID=UPI00037B8668|nr:BofC C-terminal domain-containing protein [Paenibacillus daejeonensis]